MCLIIVVKKGVSKSSDFLIKAIRTASVTNKDGIGFAYKRAKSNKVYVAKGYTHVEEFIEILLKKKLKLEDELVIHLRIGNKGAKTAVMNHPFVLSSDDEIVRSNDKFVDLPVLVHNGTIYDFGEYNGFESDTYCFTRDFMSVPEIQTLLKRDYKLFAKTFKFVLKTNRIAFIFPDNTPIITLGEFNEDQGYLFSNESYIKKICNVGGVTHQYEAYYGGKHPAACVCNKCKIERMNEAYEEEDDAINARPLVNSKYTNTGFNLPVIGNPTAAQLKIEELLLAGKATKIGQRVRDAEGLLAVDSKIDIVPPKVNEDNKSYACVFNYPMKSNMYPIIGHVLYTPLRYMHTQFASTMFIPKSFNYKHFTYINPLGNYDREISANKVYKIIEFDQNINRPASVHLIGPTDYDPKTLRGVTDVSWYSNLELVRYFMCVIDSGEVRDAYVTLYRLVQKYNIPSKTLCAQALKGINGAMKKEESKHNNITFKSVGKCSLLGLKLFYNYEVSAMYDPDIAKKMYFQVQEEDDDKTITYQEALEGINSMSN